MSNLCGKHRSARETPFGPGDGEEGCESSPGETESTVLLEGNKGEDEQGVEEEIRKGRREGSTRWV